MQQLSLQQGQPVPATKRPPAADLRACRLPLPPLPQSVDWLGRVEHFDEDFAALLRLLNSRPGVPQLPLPTGLSAVNRAEEAPCEHRRSRRLAQSIDPQSAVWRLKEGTFNPCDPLDYFRLA